MMNQRRFCSPTVPSILCLLLLIASPSTAIKIRASEATIILKCRGGGSYLQQNSNYSDDLDHNRFLPPMLGDPENNQIRRSHSSHDLNHNTDYYNNYNNNNDQYSARTHQQRQPKPIVQVVQEFFQQLHASSPALFYGSTSSILVFILWQIPQFASILRNNFVCSQYNLSKWRYHTMLTSIVSHTTLSHILMNLYGFLIFGKSIEPILKMNDMTLAAYCVFAGVFANAFFVKMHSDGSCIGLSGVTLSLLALDAKLHPSKEIGFLIRFIPIRLPAQYALTGLLIWSILGMMATMNGRSDGVAHATHFGGLIFGIGVYELMNRGIWRRWRRSWKQFRIPVSGRKVRALMGRDGKRLHSRN